MSTIDFRRIEQAVRALPPEKRPYSLRDLYDIRSSLGDVLTDLAPFIQAEIDRLASEGQP